MARVCTVCTHPDRDEIDAELVQGTPYRDIARQYSVSKDAVARHKEHVRQTIARVCDVQDLELGAGLVEKLQRLELDARRIATEAEKSGDLKTALGGIRELTRIVELFAKLRGEIQEGGTINVLVAPEWAALRFRILNALLPFPDARFAVAEALERGGNE